jgi:hypothetical protein
LRLDRHIPSKSIVTGAAAFLLPAMFGENTSSSATSELRSGTRTFSSFSDAIMEVKRCASSKIHFRRACVRADALGGTVAESVATHAMLSDDDDRD